jgi:hypothetical protein
MAKCIFDVAWCGRCTAEATEGQFCDKHKVLICVVCGKQATKECDYAGQFVCGAPLCDECTYFNDPGKASGNWGFMNHQHVSKKPSTAL